MRVDELNSFSSLLARYRAALGRLENLGIRISASSRLRAYEDRLQQAIDDPRPALDQEFVVTLAFDLREVDEIVEIVESLPGAPDLGALRLLRRLPAGGENPDEDGASGARESQYELYLGTVLRRSGIAAQHGEPDLRVEWGQQSYFIEAKRPSSQKRVDDRLRSAVHQVRAQGTPGIIALSLDQVLRPPMTILSAPELEHVAPEVERLVHAFVLKTAPMWKARLAGGPVAALLLTARVPARLQLTGHLVLGTSVHPEVLTSDQGWLNGLNSGEFVNHVAQAYMEAQSHGAV